MREQRRWCEAFDILMGYGTRSDLHYRCRRCGVVYLWSDFASIEVGPCIAARWLCLEAQ